MISEKFDTWEIQFSVAINFVSSKNKDENCVVHSKSDDKGIKINVKAVKIVKKTF